MVEWIVACDQPFDEVEKPEFISMLQYAHHSPTNLKLPSRDGIRRRVMKLGEETVEGTREMFKVGVYPFFFSQHLTLDCRPWTGRSAFHLMHGRQAMASLFWPLWLTTLPMMES
jgi:hypothetical protein